MDAVKNINHLLIQQITKTAAPLHQIQRQLLKRSMNVIRSAMTALDEWESVKSRPATSTQYHLWRPVDISDPAEQKQAATCLIR
jgi:LmbE family N-acetylglucosaminyl deacetylase